MTTVYKLHAGDNPLGMMGVLLREPALSINRGRMSAKGWITKQAPDRAHDIMIAAGGIVDDHRRLPTVHLAHNKLIPCGRAEDKLGTYTVKQHGDGWQGETYFSQSTEVGEQTFRLVETKVLCGMSIGFMPVGGAMERSAGGGVVYKQWRLIEYSHVAIPEHQDCLVEAVYKGLGGKPLCAALDGYLRPLCPDPTESVTSGWDAEAIAKGGPRNYRTAEPKEVEAKFRPAIYYTCPHCGEDMSHEHIYKDADGTTRHGPCRGAVHLKPPEPTTGLEMPVGSAPAMPYKTLGEYIAKRLTYLREKAMQAPPRKPGTPPVDEFAPVDPNAPLVDPNADPNAALDPNAPPLDPHADHKAVVDDAVGNVLASIYDKFTSGQVDMAGAIKLFKDCLAHHGNVASLGVGDDPDADMDLDDEPDPEDLDDDGVPDDEEDDTADAGSDVPPKKKPAGPPKKKAKYYHEYTPEMETWITKGYRLANTLRNKLESGEAISQAKLKAVCEDLLDSAATLEPVVKAIDDGVLVTKAKPTVEWTFENMTPSANGAAH